LAEILTESFCERCGTRYTFESAAPRHRRLGGFKTLSKGLRNFVLSDDTSLDEALAAARSDEERETTVQQLDAFHQTFNFCMSCRQYTCGNCWSDVAGQCLSCSPLGAATFAPAAGATDAIDEAAGFGAGAWPVSDVEATPDEPIAVPASNGSPPDDGGSSGLDRLSSLLGIDREGAGTPETPEAVDTATDAASAVDAELPPPEPAIAEPPLPELAPTAAFDTSEPDLFEEPAESDEERATAAASQTRALLARFRPGQSLDDALEAYEALEASDGTGVEAQAEPMFAPGEDTGLPEPGFAPDESEAEPAAAMTEPLMLEPAPAPIDAQPDLPAVEPEPVFDEPRPVFAEEPVLVTPEPLAAAPEPEPIAAASEPEPEPVAAAPEPEPIAAASEPEPVAAAPEPEPITAAPEPEPEPEPIAVAPEPEPEPVAAALEPEPEPVAAAPEPEPEPIVAAPEPEPAAEPTPPFRDDRVEVPSWRMVAPESPSAADGHPAPAEPLPAAASAEPRWPTQPDEEVPFLVAQLARRSTDALWAASSAEMLATPTARVQIQSCVSCGLSLSATARFCRRCGTRQES
jgi:ribosomal protein L40E